VREQHRLFVADPIVEADLAFGGLRFEIRRNIVDCESHDRGHTSSAQLAEIANEVKPGMVATYHRSSVGEEGSNPGQDVLTEEIPRAYKGPVVAASDLDIF
jgi:ribonuclease BN (tRNA processing enzyme)